MSRIDTQKKANTHITLNGKKKSKRNMIICIVSVAVILILILLYCLLGNKANDAKTFNQVVTPDNIKEILAQINDADKTAPDAYEVYMNTTWNFPDSTQPSSDAIVGNQKTNRRTVYFTISLKDNSQQVYKSPYIPVGSSLKNIVLDEKLGAGTYPAVITYHLIDDDYNEVSHLSVNMTLIIQN